MTYWPGPPAPAFPHHDEVRASPVVGITSVPLSGSAGTGQASDVREAPAVSASRPASHDAGLWRGALLLHSAPRLYTADELSVDFLNPDSPS